MSVKHLFVPIFVLFACVRLCVVFLFMFISVYMNVFDIFYLDVFFVLITMAEDVSLNAISHSLLKLDPIIF